MTTAKKILYIEDTEANVSLMRLILKRMESVTLLHALSAELGILMAVNERPDLILMDIELPGMNGIAALKALRQKKETFNIPVIAVSGAALPQDTDNIKSASFDDVISKPFNIQAIPALIEKHLKRNV